MMPLSGHSWQKPMTIAADGPIQLRRAWAFGSRPRERRGQYSRPTRTRKLQRPLCGVAFGQWTGCQGRFMQGAFAPNRSFMFRLTFRFLGLLLLAGAVAALVIDGTRSIAGGAPSLTPLEQTLLWLMPQKFAMLKLALRHALPPFLWNHVAVHVLLMPTWLVVGVIGILLMLLSRKRRPKIGYADR
jgi:hypothetical protein